MPSIRSVLLTLSALTMASSAWAQDAADPVEISILPPARESTPFTLKTDQPRSPEQIAVRFDMADLTIRVIPDYRAIDAVAVLDFTALEPVQAVVVDLDTRFDVTYVRLDGIDVPAGVWTNPEGRMTVPIGRTLAPGERVSLRIAYGGQPREAPHAPWDGGFVWSTAPGGEPWIATAVQGAGCDLFWPCIDSPLAEPARVDLHITVPSALAAPSNGRFVSKVDHGDGWTTWNWSAANPNTYAIALNVGPYEEVTRIFHSRFGNDFPLSFWHLRSDDPAKVQTLFDQFAPMVEFFEATVGPYPFSAEKMGVVETPHLGMEHQTINAYGNGYKLDGRGFDWLLQHELSHEWFGNQLTNRNADDMWLHEGLGSYMQPLYDRWLHGEMFMQASLLEQRRDLINRFPVVSGTDKSEDEVYQGDIGPGLDLYNKGSLITHSLRMLIGDEAFFRSVTRLVYGTPDPAPGRFVPRYGTTPEFLQIVNQETGQDLAWFFDGYLYQAALPDLRQTRDDTGIALEWVTGNGAAFPMPVEIEVDGRRSTIDMAGGRGRIAARPGAHVLIDPDNKVLRRLDFIEAWKATGSSN